MTRTMTERTTSWQDARYVRCGSNTYHHANPLFKARGLRGGSIPTKIRLTYYQEVSLKVELQYKAADEWTECFETEAIKLPQSAYLGFSAETGELSDNHDIISVSSSNLHIRQDRGSSSSKKAKPYNPGGDKERGSWRWFFLKIVLFGIVAVGGYVGYTTYRASKRNSRFWDFRLRLFTFLSFIYLKLAQPCIVLDKLSLFLISSLYNPKQGAPFRLTDTLSFGNPDFPLISCTSRIWLPFNGSTSI